MSETLVRLGLKTCVSVDFPIGRLKSSNTFTSVNSQASRGQGLPPGLFAGI
jgi:hypothetical protein